MLGTRGARLGLMLPGLYEMQVRAVVEAALEVSVEGAAPQVEIMLPLIAYESELVALCELVDLAVERHPENREGRIEVELGTMIELPRACLVAGRSPSMPSSSVSARTTLPRPPSVSLETTPSAASCPSTSHRGWSRRARSRPSKRGWGSC